MAQHEKWMRRCFELALRGEGRVSPNPMVGAVLVHQHQIIGEGWHQQWGGPHAEVNCYASVAPEHVPLIPEATLYCSLEPCSHFGKTPPCVDLILQRKTPVVVVANVDPNPLVAGKGLHKLREAGVSVIEGVMAQAGQWLNRSFFHWITESKPYVILKWAQSADGFMGLNGRRTAISQAPTRRLVHRWRAAADAILVGAGTAIVDDPILDIRYYFGKPPIRLLLDASGGVPENHQLMADAFPTWIFGKYREGFSAEKRFFPSDTPISVQSLLATLKQESKAVLLVEGGAAVLNQFLTQGCWNEIRLIENPIRLGEGVAAPLVPATNCRLVEKYHLGMDEIKIFAHTQIESL